ncbi:MAG: ankyrin repeat domain-containing protein [Verrucomicrobiota bacterium]
MKIRTLLSLLSIGVGLAQAAEPLNEAFQRGLLEEEGNRNLDAAIASYRTAIREYDEQRKIAGSALFRLAESYRKQGKTNEARVYYERVAKEFPDQAEIAALSRKQIGPRTSSPQNRNLSLDRVQYLQKELIASEQMEVQYATLLEELKKKNRAELRNALPSSVPDEHLNRHLAELATAEQKLTVIKRQYGAEHPEHAQTAALIAKINEQIESRIDGILAGMEAKVSQSRAARKALEQKLSVELKEYELASQPQLLDIPIPDVAATKELDEEQKEIERLKKIIKESPDLVNAKTGPPGGIAETPLHRAAGLGQLQVVRFLVENLVDIDARDYNGDTPLHRAAGRGYKAVVEFLVNAGADVNGKSRSGKTPLHVAASQGHVAVMESLLAFKADPNARDRTGRTPLHDAAASTDRRAALEILLKHGAEIEAKNSADETPLFVAATADRIGTVALLIAKGADVQSKGPQGDSVLHWASSAGNFDLVRLLLDQKANVNATNKYGETPLHSAVKTFMKNTAQLLMDRGADVNAIAFGPAIPNYATGPVTPLDVLMRNPVGVQTQVKEELREFLEAHGAKSAKAAAAESRSAQGTQGNLAIPSDSTLYFMGEVKANALPLAPGSEKTISQALLQVGVTEFANLKRVKISRMDPSTKVYTNFFVNVSDINQGKTNDVVLQAGDRIHVGGKLVNF